MAAMQVDEEQPLDLDSLTPGSVYFVVELPPEQGGFYFPGEKIFRGKYLGMQPEYGENYYYFDSKGKQKRVTSKLTAVYTNDVPQSVRSHITNLTGIDHSGLDDIIAKLKLGGNRRRSRRQKKNRRKTRR